MHEFATPPIRYNLASSAGPSWSVGDLLALGGDAARAAFQDIRLTYAPPEGSALLRERIAQLYDVDPDWVVVTTGASEAVSVLMGLFAEPGGSVVLPDPVFPALSVMARTWGLDVRSYALSRDSSYLQTADQVLTAVSRQSCLALVNTPHNPTGSVMAEAEMVSLAGHLGERGIPLVVDEVYHPLYFGPRVASAARIPNAIVVSDFSKAFSLAGLRLGWIIDRDPARRQRLIDLRSYLTISSSPLSEALGALALLHRESILDRLTQVAQKNLALLSTFLVKHRDVLTWIAPAGGTIAFPWFVDGRNARPFSEVLARAGVLIAPGDCFDAPAHFRVGFGAQAEGYADALGIASHILSTPTI